LPDGDASGRRRLALPTPGGTNSPAAPPVEVFINEWMAGNAGFLADPADAGAPDYEDWFELYNAGSEPADLGDFYLTDTLTNRTKWKIPDGTVIPPGGHLLVWADEETEQNGFNADLHANFKLSLGGEQLGLFAPDGALVDAVTFGPQTNNISQGRFPDGGVAVEFMTNATPRAANRLARPNTPPTLAGLGPRSVNEGSLLLFTAQATDDDLPAQRLTFSLDAGAPALAAINPTNGVFTWTPGEADGPGVYEVTVRVTDDGAPPASDAKTFTITVHEVNNAPVLAPLANRVIEEGGTLVVTNLAFDPDPGGQRLTFSFASTPFAGMTIDPDTGLITWIASESYGPGNHNVTIRVRDDGDPPLHDEKTLSVFVNEVNQSPTLAPIADLTVSPATTVVFEVTGFDADVPAQALSYTLDSPSPSDAAVDAVSGRFTWTPGLELAGTTNLFTVRVSDDGMPALATTRSFTITVAAALRLSRVAVSPEGIVSFVWPALPGKVYRVEFKDALDAGAWRPLGEDRLATGGEMIAMDPAAPPGGRFYRVRQVD
ncbi:MAG TPA: putative Ig domain-containing protein, partial [Methylomirabilota bacterium]|nr:putative Ig domain-containing protein [Methylomirabilota bacterium]